MKTAALVCSVIALGASSAACGGGSKGPRPLTYHVDASRIEAAQDDARITAAYDEYLQAKIDHQRSLADLTEADTDLRVARSRLQKADARLRAAKRTSKLADATNDQRRRQAAARQVQTTGLARQLAAGRVNYLALNRTHKQHQLRYAHEALYAKEAAYELAKARLLQTQNALPEGTELGGFETQASDRARRSQRAKATADRTKGTAEGEKRRLEALEREAADVSTASGLTTIPKAN